MKLMRKDFLQKLLLLEPGISKGSFHQSDCIVFKNGRFYTFNQEVACSLQSGLPSDWQGAFPADKVIALTKLLVDDEIVVERKEKTLAIRGKRPRAEIPLETEILLPVDVVEKPEGWVTIKAEFAEAADITHRCTRKRKPGEDISLAKECVHVTPKWMEASDNDKMVRYELGTFVKEPLLIRGTTIKSICQLGMTKGCETPTWLHFWNPFGLRMSLRKHAKEKYPALDQFLNMRGMKVVLPKRMIDAVKRCSVFDEEKIKVLLTTEHVIVSSESHDGIFSERTPWKGKDQDVAFLIHPKLLVEIIENESACEITDRSIRIDGGKYIFVASLERAKI